MGVLKNPINRYFDYHIRGQRVRFTPGGCVFDVFLVCFCSIFGVLLVCVGVFYVCVFSMYLVCLWCVFSVLFDMFLDCF